MQFLSTFVRLSENILKFAFSSKLTYLKNLKTLSFKNKFCYKEHESGNNLVYKKKQILLTIE